ncbi:MAG: hypothetical protein KDD37_08910 [Bdellovibrionales bacterium]|nr:hypothetical protein [Bdellovibrionales bacterium]
MGIIIFISFFWGYNEGLWFFIIPDIALSIFALKGWKPALYSTLATVFGSMLAAVTLFILLRFYKADTFTHIWSSFPGFYPKMLSVARLDLSTDGARGLLNGPTSGIPYRFYALEAYMINISILDLLIWTPLARLQRVILAPVAVLTLKWLLPKIFSRLPLRAQRHLKKHSLNKSLLLVICLYWIYIYVWYWGNFLPSTYGP